MTNLTSRIRFYHYMSGVLINQKGDYLCGKCKAKGVIPEEDLKLIDASMEGDMYKYAGLEFPVADGFVKGEGCEACNGTGLKGRMGVHELLRGTDEVKRMIVSGARIAEIREACKIVDEKGYRMYELFEDGYIKALMGNTSIQQIRSVCIS